MNTVLLQLERLRRHYESAVRTYDHVSLLDLSHSLRVWTELKQPLTTISPKFATSISFKTAIPAKRVFRAARDAEYVFSYMPGGVRTYASNGQLASGPGIGPSDGDFTIGITVKASPPFIELGNYCVVKRCFDQPLVKALGAEQVTRCTFTQWLGAEAVRVSFPGEGGLLDVVAISREMIIKRVANTLDGSHPSAAGAVDASNVFDPPIRRLLQYQMGGLPLPYFILLKIAQDILEVAPKLLSQHGANGT